MARFYRAHRVGIQTTVAACVSFGFAFWMLVYQLG